MEVVESGSKNIEVAVMRLEASHFCLPQMRVRAFVVCTLGGTAERARDLERRARATAGPETTMRDVFPHMQTSTIAYTLTYSVTFVADKSLKIVPQPCLNKT